MKLKLQNQSAIKHKKLKNWTFQKYNYSEDINLSKIIKII